MTPIDIPISSAAPSCEWGVEAPLAFSLEIPDSQRRRRQPVMDSLHNGACRSRGRGRLPVLLSAKLHIGPRLFPPRPHHHVGHQRWTTSKTTCGARGSALLRGVSRAEQVCKAENLPGRKPVLRATHIDRGGPRHNLEPMGSRWDLSGNLDVGPGGQSTRAPLMTPGPAKGLLVWVATWMY